MYSRSEKTDKGNEFQLCSTAKKCGPVSVRKIGFFLKWKLSLNPQHDWNGWGRRQHGIQRDHWGPVGVDHQQGLLGCFQWVPHFAWYLISYPIALHWQIFNCCICFSFGVIGHIFTLVLMLFCCVFALLLTAFWVLLPFFVTLQILRFANLGKDTSGTRLSTCNNHLRRVQKLFCHLVFLAPQLLFSIWWNPLLHGSWCKLN